MARADEDALRDAALKQEAKDFSALYGEVTLLDVCLGALNCTLVSKGLISKAELRDVYRLGIAKATVKERERRERIARVRQTRR